MSSMPDPMIEVVGGVDTHREFHVAAALDQLGRVLGTGSFPATRAGYRELLGWLGRYGSVTRVGVEGTGAWGAGLTRFLSDHRVEVVEVIRPNRQHRRRYGKSDTTDAVAAARAVLSGEANGAPRGGTGPVESLRFLKVARRSAMKHRTAVANQIHAVIVTAPTELRATLNGLALTAVVDRAVRYRPRDPSCPHDAAKLALNKLASRYRYLTNEISDLDIHIEQLVSDTAPEGLLDLCGIGPQTAADLLITAGSHPDRIRSEQAFAALCGTSPVDASSGRNQHHRLNRGGDRQANAALYRIVIVRLRYRQPTRDYMQRRLKQGLQKRQIIRCIKRYVAREIWKYLTTTPQPQPI
jgi:transposase